MEDAMRIGQGWDRHRLVPGRPLILGGVLIPWEKGCEAHSDGDALAHALIDALLGALALGDIGDHFPPGDERWKNADSLFLLEQTGRLIRQAGYKIQNADCSLIMEAPKLGALKAQMAAKLESALAAAPGTISVKAKTAEGCDAAGRGEALEAQAVVLLVPAAPKPGA